MTRAIRPLAAALALLPFTHVAAGEEKKLDEVSVTATREARATAEVPQAIAVVGKEKLEQRKMYNVKEALQEIPGVLIDSKNGGFDARLLIRGAGLKAAYGIREIMILRDGVPLTDPDSLTRLDWVDTQDIERIEVAKGPGNLFATGSSGGAIQIFSKSVFDQRDNSLRIAYGNENAQNYHLRYGWQVGDNQVLALTATHRSLDNDWRRWNQFDTTQTSLKHGLLLGGGDTLESELSYAEANIQLPGVMDTALFNQFLSSGKQSDTSEAWKHSGRYSKVWFFNTRLELERGDFSFKPRLYYNTWYHYHPVTGVINETDQWVWNLGTDLEAHYRHNHGTLVGGITLRKERTPDSRKYQYASVKTTTSHGACVDSSTATGRILATCSDARGRLAEIDDMSTLLTGLYLQESWRPAEGLIVDVGGRYDVVRFKDHNDQTWRYDWATGKYAAGAGRTSYEKTFYLPAPKLAVSYRLNAALHAYAMIAQAGQVPSSSEISSNHALDAATARNREIGLKGRAAHWSFEASLYHTDVRDEIVQQTNGGVTTYLNAGKTRKKGFEVAGSFALGQHWELGGYYSRTNYRYLQFSEPVRMGNRVINLDRAGKTLPFVPRHQYGLSLGWKGYGWRVRLSSNTWGEYWLDNANSEKYPGWKWVTNLSVSYGWGPHSLAFNADNLFDKRYAAEVKKDTSNRVTYAAATPRTLMLTYRYDFR